MLNNEIRRLVRCIVEASAESNIQIEEIQAEIARQFGKEIQPQVYQNIELKDFREKAIMFCKNEVCINPGYASFGHAVELLCIFHELRAKTPKEDTISYKMIIEIFMERRRTTESTSKERCAGIGKRLQGYLEEEKGIKMRWNARTVSILEEVYPFIMQM